MADPVELVIRTVDKSTGTISEIRRALGGLESDAKGIVGRGMGGFTNLLGVGLKTAAAAGTAALGGLGAVIGTSVHQAIDFESAFTGVIKTVDATDAELGALRRGILDMTGELPASASSIASVAEAAGQLGIKTANVLDFTRVMSDLGVATNMSAEDAATALARFANITGMSQTDFDRLGSSIVELGNNLATTEGEIVAMGLRIAGAGSQIGLSEAQILALAGSLSSVGIEAEAGGTAISRVMIDMANAVSAGGDELDTIAQVAGMTSAEFASAFRDDAAVALMAFISGLDNVSKSGGNVFGVLEDLGMSEIRVRDTLLRASGASDLFAESLDMSTAAWEANVALTTEAELRYGTMESRLQLFRNAVDVVRIGIGDKFLPVLSDLTAWATAMVQQHAPRVIEFFGYIADALAAGIQWLNNWLDAGTPVSAWFELLPEPVQQTTQAVRGFISTVIDVIQPIIDAVTQFVSWQDVLTAFGLLIAAIVIPAIGSFIAAIAPVVAVVAGAIAIVATMRHAWQENWFGIRDHVAEIVAKLQEIIRLGMGLVQKLWGDGGGQLQGITQTIWAAIGAIVDAAMATIKTILDVAIALLQGDWQGAWDIIKTAADEAWQRIKELIKSGLDAVLGFFTTGPGARVLGWLQETFPGATQAMRDAWDRAVDAVKGILGQLGGATESTGGLIKNVLGSIATWWQQHGDKVRDIIDRVLARAIASIGDYVEAIAKVIKAILLAIQGDWSGAWESMREALQIIWDRIKDNISAVLKTLRTVYDLWLAQYVEAGLQKFREMRDGIVERVTTLRDNIIDRWQRIKEFVVDAATDMANMVMERIRAWKDWLGEQFQKIWNFVDTYLNPVKWVQAGRDFIQGLWDGFRERWNQFVNWAGETWQSWVNRFKNFFGIHSPSTLFYGYGRDIGSGLAGGIADTAGAVWSELESIGAGLTSRMEQITQSIGGALSGGLLKPVTDTLAGGISIIDPAKAKENQAKFEEYVGALGEFIGETVAGVNQVYSAIDNLAVQGVIDESTRASLIEGARAASRGLHDVLLQLSGQTSALLDQDLVQAALANITPETAVDLLQGLLQSAVDFRGAAADLPQHPYYGSPYDSIMPTDSRLTGQTTNNNYDIDINLTSSGDAANDIVSTVDLLNALVAA